MDPMNREPEDFGQDRNDDGGGIADDGAHHGHEAARRPPRDTATPDSGQPAPLPALTRTVQLVCGDSLLTVNPVDGSEIEPCPPGERPGRPVRYDAADRAELARAARAPLPAGPALPRLPLLERQEEREGLVRFLARGRSVRLTGPSGSGRTALLDQVADDCADLAPDGIVRLSGHQRSATDVLYDLFAAVYKAPLHRPDRPLLLELVRDIGAVVVLDDLEFGGAALDELLDATPECAFLLSATPDVPRPSADSHIEEIHLGGLGRGAGLELLERTLGRVLTDDEANWAGDLWFESEGLPLRFVQAGALLRQRDELPAEPATEFGAEPGTQSGTDLGADEPPLPTLAEGAAPVALLASRLSESARTTLRFAVALGGEIPHQAHLPALVGDTHADAALAELVSCALVTPVGRRYRLASGVRTQLLAAGYGDDTDDHAEAAGRHYAWWVAHPSVAPERVAAEADAVLAALTALVPRTRRLAGDEPAVAVELARAVAPALAAGLAWSAWERALRSGQEAALRTGAVPEQAYFHHELGILALLGGQLDRARAELEASIGLRGALSDKRGTIAGRRALALVADRSGEVPRSPYEEFAPPAPPAPADEAETVVTRQAAAPTTRLPRVTGGPAADDRKVPTRRAVALGTRRNLVAAGAGALLAAVLGTVVAVGAMSGDEQPPAGTVGSNPSASVGDSGGDLGADTADPGSTGQADPGKDGTPGTSDDPTPSASGTASTTPSTGPTGSSSSPDAPTTSPTTSPSTTPGPTHPSSSQSTTSTTSPSAPSPTTSSSPSSSDSSSPPSMTPTPGQSSSDTSASGPAAGASATTSPTDSKPSVI
ncbi:ATP-binding protein [Streptomyces beihaiensis]|uniref:ATP-binding protein n=1 Tax=Streptomyces beihaiensis TaxID=2984495 RepID=A0ABT3U477_9ACTN|nr:ATP-binding protein [Streptomyces beihaiensis]MCX3064116.1 ATP-binding protein [Streptomyces beihaiensis]